MNNRTTKLAFEIADDAASCDIETMCLPVGGEPETRRALKAQPADHIVTAADMVKSTDHIADTGEMVPQDVTKDKKP